MYICIYIYITYNIYIYIYIYIILIYYEQSKIFGKIPSFSYMFIYKNIQNKHYYPKIKCCKSVKARLYPESVLLYPKLL